MPIGEPLIQLFEVDSTNNYAMAQVQAHLAGHGSVYIAHSQTSGKGQRGKSWLSEPGQNILLSAVINPSKLFIGQKFILSAITALACREFFEKYTRGDVKIKWPNDIYWKDRKAGGILMENIIRGGHWKFSIAGIGLNINQTQFSQGFNPVSLAQITGKKFDILLLAKELCDILDKKWDDYKEDAIADILAEYNLHLYKLNEKVNLKIKEAILSCRITGVNALGELVVHTNKELVIGFGQAEWQGS